MRGMSQQKSRPSESLRKGKCSWYGVGGGGLQGMSPLREEGGELGSRRRGAELNVIAPGA